MNSLKALIAAIDKMSNDLHSKGGMGDDEDMPMPGKKPVAVEIAMSSKPKMGDALVDHDAMTDMGDDAGIDAHHPMTAGEDDQDMGADPAEVVDLLKANFPDVYDEIVEMLNGGGAH